MPLSIHLLSFPSSGEVSIGSSFQQHWRRPDEGGPLHGARRGRGPATQPLFHRLGRQVLLVAAVVHANVCPGLRPQEVGDSHCQASALLSLIPAVRHPILRPDAWLQSEGSFVITDESWQSSWFHSLGPGAELCMFELLTKSSFCWWVVFLITAFVTDSYCSLSSLFSVISVRSVSLYRCSISLDFWGQDSGARCFPSKMICERCLFSNKVIKKTKRKKKSTHQKSFGDSNW